VNNAGLLEGADQMSDRLADGANWHHNWHQYGQNSKSGVKLGCSDAALMAEGEGFEPSTGLPL
jgi:hypothetical protein